MRIFLAFILINISAPIVIATNAFGQTTLKKSNISYSAKNESIQDVFTQLSKLTGFYFFYDESVLADIEPVSLHVQNKDIDAVLNTLAEKTSLAFKQVDNTISVSRKGMNKSTELSQEKKKVSGVVKDKSGETIIGATILEKGTMNGVSTDLDGAFSIRVSGSSTLVISYIGYRTQEIVVGTNDVLNIQLEEDAKSLDEVVVVGYGTQKKSSLTGAMEVIKSDELMSITTPSVENMLNGKLAGVYVAPSSGQPGSASAVVIRGKASISGNVSPLWVIDGVIVGDNAGALNPADISSMTVLKDAASTAIYGSQGANGVVVITTKNAISGKTSVNLSAKVGVSTLNNGNLEMMDGADLYDYYSSFSNASVIAFPRWNEDLRNSNFDWWDLATQVGTTQDYNISMSSGTDKLKSFFSLGLYDEEGAVKGYDYTRYNFRMKVDYMPLEWLTVKPSISASRRDIDDAQYSTSAMYSRFPWDSPYDENGELVPHRYSGWVNSVQTNYLYDLQWNKSSSTFYEFMGNIDFDIKFTDYLTFSSVNNFRYQGSSSSSYVDPRSSAGESVDGRITENRSDMVRRYTNQIIRFNKTYDLHSVNALVAYEFNDYNYKTIEAIGTGFLPGFEILDVVSLPENVEGGISEWAVQSVLFNANYAYDNKYLAQFSFRRDGASNFGDNAKYGNFYSISGGWNMNREEWFTAEWVDMLKVRASYGSVGNRPSSLYPQYDLYSVSSSYDGNPATLISQIGNRDLTWEKTFTTGIGVDGTFFDNRLRVNIDYYSKYTDNILFNVPVSGLVGVTSIWKNVGEMLNTGVELSLGGDIIRTTDWNWSLDFNIGNNKNEVKKLYGDDPNMQIIVSDGLGIAGSTDKLLKVGYSSDSFYLREWAGVNTETGAPQWYKTEKDADGNESRVITEKIAEADKVIVGESTPTVFGGFSTALDYKNIDLSANFGYSIGGKIFNYSRLEYDSDGTYTDRNQMKLHDGWNRWEKPGDIATHPVASYNNSSKANNTSSRYLEDGDFFKLRSLSLGYTLALNKFSISSIRLSFTGENLFTITDYSGVDPELPVVEGKVIGSTGPSVYPSVRKYMFGLNITF